MNSQPVSVLICDDSALMRNLIGRIIEGADGLEVVGKAMNGRFALQKIPKLNPDVMILDLEMPEMNGIEFLKERKRLGLEVPVVILSSIAKRGARVTMEALALGACDFILKPSGSISEDIHTIGDHIVNTVRAYGSRFQRQKPAVKAAPSAFPKTPNIVIPPKRELREPVRTNTPGIVPPPSSLKADYAAPLTGSARPGFGSVDLIAVGISTGGPNALREVLANIDPNINVPILIVQHMPPGFTEEFAHSLDRISPLEVKEAAEGDLVKPGRVLIAPGHSHIEIERRPLATIVHLSDAPPQNGHRPSADVLFKSVAKSYGKHAMGVIMTGMGRDGAREIGTIYNNGGITIGQDEQSCIVYGMPKVAAENGYIDHVVSLKEIAATISKVVKDSKA